jgi:L-ascorbate metabolism protein UlaG (beta-lactamase superfamily)
MLASLGLTLVTGGVVADGWMGFGKGATGDRKARMEASPQWNGKGFDNPQPLWNDVLGSIAAVTRKSDHTDPAAPVPVLFSDGSQLQALPASGLRVTWLGHSTILLEVDGVRVLTDPIFGERASPLTWAGPKRWYAPPIPLTGLPPVDVVLLSHDHYDHLQLETFAQLRGWDTTFVAPLGVGAHLEYWGVPAERIVELDWWERTEVDGVELVCTPARHASGRSLTDQNDTLWAGWAVRGPQHSVFFSGDTGMFDALSDIGERLGPFDLAMIEVGAYDRAWPDWHIGPEQAVAASQLVQGAAFLPIHWGLWNLSMHGWTEPVERVAVAAEKAGVRWASPRPGESFEPTVSLPTERWWPAVPWQTADEHPIVSTANGVR